MSLTGVLLVLAVASALACSATEPEPLPPIAHDGDLALSPRRLVGCYRVTSLQWYPAAPDDPAMTPPGSFELSAEPAGYPGSRIVRVAGRRASTFLNWLVTGPQEVTVNFSSGYVGVRFVLRQRPHDGAFYGRVEPLSESGGIPNKGYVLVERVACGRE